MNTVIKTLQQVQQAQSDAWVWGAIVVIVALALAILIAQLTNDNKPDPPDNIVFAV